MANVNVNKSGPADLADNFPAAGLQDYHDGRREYKPQAEHQDWRVVVAGGVVAGGALALLWLLWGVWKSLYCWQSVNWSRCDAINAAEPGAVALVLLLVASAAVAWAVVRLATAWRLGRSRAARTATTYNRWGNPVRVDLFTAPEYEAARYALDVALKERTAQHEALHSINTYSPTYQLPKDGAAPALPAPAEPQAALIPADTWLSWLGEAPHLLISGPTGAGKTTLARALLAEASGENLLVLDPHDAAGKWPLEAVGGGRDYDGIYTAIDALMAEMTARFERLKQGETVFPRLIILLDEAPAVALHDLKRWQALVSRLTSEARKVEMRFVVLAQSHLVQDIGLSSLVRRNLGLVALGPQALDLVKTETEPERRRQLLELVRGQKRPAAYAYASQTEVLDVGDVPSLARQRITLAPWAWTPPPPSPEELQRQAVVESLRRGARISRRQARANGLHFSNDRWPDMKG